MTSHLSDKLSEFRPSRTVASIEVSEILSIGARANAMRKAGRDIISLGAGEPDFDTPDHVKDAAIDAIRRGETKYTPLDGTPALKAAIRSKFKRDNGLDFEPDEISVSAGAKQVIANAMAASLDPGDEVIIPAPYWVSYIDIVKINGGTPVIVKCSEDTGFRLTPEALEQAITPRTRWLFLNSPSNPCGAAYRAEDYRAILSVLERHPHVWVLADDIYEHIIYDDFRFVTPAEVAPHLKDRILTINGVSKAYAMTGWRIGYGAGPKALIKAMAVVQSQSTSNPCSVSQAAAIAALDGDQSQIKARCLDFEKRRDLIVRAIEGIDGLQCRKPEGAFYAFVKCEGVIGRKRPDGMEITSDRDFTDYLLDSVGVAAVPGSAFGLAPYFRISYAASMESLEDALGRIASACTKLRLP